MNSKGSSSSSSLLIGGPIGSCRDSNGSPDVPTSAPPPPAPPPPPPLPSSVPAGTRPGATAIRINPLETAVPMRRRPLSNDFGPSNDAYEPPAAIQNAMMTKDKKPFTYTPGMGGKLDLSQIRSPRMARRVAKNANDEGIEAPPRSAAAATAPVPAASSLYAAQPRVAVPVFPTGPATTNNNNNNNNSNNNNRLSSNVQVKIATPATPTWSQPSPPSPPSPPSTPTSPTTPSSAQIVLAKAPTPWLQNRSKSQQEELPEWAKRKQSSVPSPPPPPERQHQPQPQQQHNQRERIIPLRIEDRPSVFSTDNGARQRSQPPQQPVSRHQQRWGNASPSPPVDAAVAGAGTYIVPIILEAGLGDGTSIINNNNNNNSSNRVIIRNAGGGGGPPSPQYQETTEPAPVQSRSFRVLQKITDTDLPIDRVDGQQSRKLRLTENDKLLMNKVKERVDGEGAYLHQEEDPRYRGAAIPSRAFRYLRNMTDSADPSLAVATVTVAAPGVVTSPAVNKIRPTINSSLSPADEFRTIVPASEQQAPEPKKYTGSAIPSRSFRMLQAMTSPESIGPDQTDY